MNHLKSTDSLCPECLAVVPATIYEKKGKVYISKTCLDHGEFTDLYWGDYDQYTRVLEYGYLGTTMKNPRTEEKKGCPYDCGVCTNHKSTTVLGIIDVTNRCNLRCPICFAHAGAAGYLYEPTINQIREMMENLLANDPVWTPALQLSGGEPTVRDDLPEIVEMAKDLGFIHVEVNSNGIKMAESSDYCWELKKAGVDTVYLQFDGVTPEPHIKARGFNLLPIKLKAIENLKKSKFYSTVLVPVLVKGVNDEQVGDIIRFALENRDCVRGVNFQPVSFTGRINREERESMRITIPDLMRLAEEQTDGLIKPGDWYPPSILKPVSDFLSEIKNEHFVDMSCHPHCGMGTYLFFDGGDPRSVTEYVNVDLAIKTFEKANEKLSEGKELRAKLEVAAGVVRNIKFRTFSKYLNDVILYSDYLSLNRMHHKMVLVAAMHFMDPYNFDLKRAERCIIHYAALDGRIIPFCTMNTLHRRDVEGLHAQPLSPDKVTPIFDVQALNQKIMEEEQTREQGLAEQLLHSPGRDTRH